MPAPHTEPHDPWQETAAYCGWLLYYALGLNYLFEETGPECAGKRVQAWILVLVLAAALFGALLYLVLPS